MIDTGMYVYIRSIYIQGNNTGLHWGREDEVGKNSSGSGRAEAWLTDQVDNRRLLQEASPVPSCQLTLFPTTTIQRIYRMF